MLGENNSVFDRVREVIFIEMKTRSPLLAFAIAEVSHKLSSAIAEPKGDGFVRSFLGKVKSSKPGISGGARFFRQAEGDYGMS